MIILAVNCNANDHLSMAHAAACKERDELKKQLSSTQKALEAARRELESDKNSMMAMQTYIEDLQAELVRTKADVVAGRVCYTCDSYKKDCFPAHPDSGCGGWKWRGQEAQNEKN